MGKAGKKLHTNLSECNVTVVDTKLSPDDSLNQRIIDAITATTNKQAMEVVLCGFDATRTLPRTKGRTFGVNGSEIIKYPTDDTDHPVFYATTGPHGGVAKIPCLAVYDSTRLQVIHSLGGKFEITGEDALLMVIRLLY